MVDIGPLLAINLDVHEKLVHHRGRHRVLEALMRHDMAPVAGGIADREQHRAAAAPGLGESLVAPLPPVDRIIAMLQKKGAGGVGEAVHRLEPREERHDERP